MYILCIYIINFVIYYVSPVKMLTLCGQRFVSVLFPVQCSIWNSAAHGSAQYLWDEWRDYSIRRRGFQYINLINHKVLAKKGQISYLWWIPDTNTLNPGPFLLHCVCLLLLCLVGWLVTQDPGMSLLVSVCSFHQGSCMVRKEREGGVALCNCRYADGFIVTLFCIWEAWGGCSLSEHAVPESPRQHRRVGWLRAGPAGSSNRESISWTLLAGTWPVGQAANTGEEKGRPGHKKLGWAGEGYVIMSNPFDFYLELTDLESTEIQRLRLVSRRKGVLGKWTYFQ